jgi:hypothetical protein
MDTKSFLQSKTLWGALVAALPALLRLLGLETLPGFTEQASAAVGEITTLVGAGIAVYGRITATKNLVVKAEKKPSA